MTDESEAPGMGLLGASTTLPVRRTQTGGKGTDERVAQGARPVKPWKEDSMSQQEERPGLVAFRDLDPGLYQVTSPDLMQTIEATVTLREDDHYWAESKSEKQDDRWIRRVVALHVNTAGLLIQAEAMGVHAVSQVVELDRNRVRVIARGYHLRADGMLEVVEKSKEYDLAAELFKAALKEVRVQQGAPAAAQSTALVQTATEETALALVGTLPPQTKARVMEARMEVQAHRESLCRTKAENQALRYFIAKGGGILRAKPGVGEKQVTLLRHMIARELAPGAARAAAETIFGRPEPAQPEPARPEPAQPKPAQPEPVTAPPDHVENENIINEEAAGEAAEEPEPPEPEEEAASGEPEPEPEPENDGPHCDDCGKALSDKVLAYCHSAAGQRMFGGKSLCIPCQNLHVQAAKAQKGAAK